MSSLRDVAHDGVLCTFSIKAQSQTVASGVVRQGRRHGPSITYKITPSCTDKKENKIFLIYKEIQNGAVAKSYNGLHIYGDIFAHSSYIRRPFLIYAYMTLQLMLHSEFPYI